MVLSGTATTADGPAAHERVIAWLERERKISRQTLGLLPAGCGTTFFPDLGRKSDAIFFKYGEGWKARAAGDKSHVAGGGFKLSFWNLDAVLGAKAGEVYITEGELDACALVEAGVPPDQVLSVPNGAREKPADDPKDVRGYSYVSDALQAGLRDKKRFIWCGDADGSGLALRSDMARMLGVARFFFVDWPEGCKDANDMLRTDGPDAVRELVSEGALSWPVDGIFRLSQLPEPPPLAVWDPGFPEWEGKIKLAPRTMSVVTGHPGSGKTQAFAQIWYQVSRAYGLPICVATFETRAKPHYRRILRTLISGNLEKHMTPEAIRHADAWIEDRYLFIQHPDQRPSLQWLLDMAEVAVVRDGARVFQIDPWNRLEDHRNKDESKTDYVGRCLKALHSFAHDMNCHVQILAHPAKMDGGRRGEPPLLEDISDSKNWDNMVDQGFVVHRPKAFDEAGRRTEATLYHRKARFEELGYPCKLELNFDVATGRYRSIDYAG